ncbi:hypothetical protein PJL11_17735 [Mycobacterium kansasii]|uniref:hypothetical protein n=1 Tax=Mycobacterium kansasii TaxID=1768 RepID=UPI001FE2A0F7|nr:hypothetical protein [Mycobacterium kansasii]
MTRDGLLVGHAIDVGDVDGEQLLEVVEGRQFFTLKAQLDQLQWVEPGRLELVSEQFAGFGQEPHGPGLAASPVVLVVGMELAVHGGPPTRRLWSRRSLQRRRGTCYRADDLHLGAGWQQQQPVGLANLTKAQQPAYLAVVLKALGELVAGELSAAPAPLGTEGFAFELDVDRRAVFGQGQCGAFGRGERQDTSLEQLVGDSLLNHLASRGFRVSGHRRESARGSGRDCGRSRAEQFDAR